MANLAFSHWGLGRWEEAEQLGIQVFKSRETKLGKTHPDTLNIMNNLASTFCN
jgi:hypothetical protein